ncbi:MAG: hypothetical protein IIC78_01305 [Chloroflexi bacterium]|nr:hypothetical protein [Chloroflexota bacterium]
MHQSRALIKVVLKDYALPRFGIHGISHWARVLENGLRLARLTGANKEVVRLFALLHDSKRINETLDPGHGLRGADFAKTLRGRLFDLTDQEFDLLFEACAAHTDGKTEGDVTVQTCWDADRLDLIRAGITPDPRFLCTTAAKDPEIILWANARSESRLAPDFIHSEWFADNIE